LPEDGSRRSVMQVEINDGTFCVDTSLLGELLDIHPADVSILMRERAITGICERGIDAHAGEFRLSFFYKNRRARVSIDTSGQILRRSIIDFGERILPQAMHKAGD
jgi:hypothetical protein